MWGLAHNSLWGSKQTDLNGEAVEDMMNDRMLVCLNNGNGTRINVYKNCFLYRSNFSRQENCQ